MGLMDKIRGEFIDIIEWTESAQSGVLAHRFQRYDNEIKNGAKLIVREGQTAIFVNQGRLADVFQPGMYTLTASSLPILSTLAGWKYGFHSPFKAEVYFISTRQWTDLKWGTQRPIMLRDTELGLVRVRAFGTFAMKVIDPTVFLRQLVITSPSFESYEVSNQLRNTITARFTDAMGRSQIPVLDLVGNYEQLSRTALESIAPDLATLGLGLTLFYIENISLPDEVNETLDVRTKMGLLGDLERFARYQAASSIGDAARNPGGSAGAGIGMGIGVALGQEITRQLASAGTTSPTPVAFQPFYLSVEGRQAGPYDAAALTEKIRDGSFSLETLVWQRGMSEWKPARTVAELLHLFTDAAPPLP